MGASYAAIDFNNEAILSYKKSLKLNDKFFETHFNIGNVYLKKMDFVNAIKHFKKAIVLNKTYSLDGDYKFNVAGLVNHSCDANARYDGKGLKIWITADKDIKKGEEITCDYGFSFDKHDYKQFPCKCRSKNCCGFIIREESRWRISQKFAMSNKKKLINNSR